MLIQSILAMSDEVPCSRSTVIGIPARIDALRIPALTGCLAIEIARMRGRGLITMLLAPLQEGHNFGLTLIGCATVQVTLFADSHHVALATLDASGWLRSVRRLRHVVAVLQAPYQEPIGEPATALFCLLLATLGVPPVLDTHRDFLLHAVEAIGKLVASCAGAAVPTAIGTVWAVTDTLLEDVPCSAAALSELPASV